MGGINHSSLQTRKSSISRVEFKYTCTEEKVDLFNSTNTGMSTTSCDSGWGSCSHLDVSAKTKSNLICCTSPQQIHSLGHHSLVSDLSPTHSNLYSDVDCDEEDILSNIDKGEPCKEDVFWSKIDKDLVTRIHCLLPLREIHLNCHGVLFDEYLDLGVVIEAPEGVVDEGVEITLKLAIGINKMASLSPKGYDKISPIIWLHPSSKVSLRKPIKITIPHFLQRSICAEKMKVMKADVDFSEAGDGSSLQFRVLPNCPVTLDIDQSTATFELLHFCFIQLYADTKLKSQAMNSAYCLCRLEPKNGAYGYPREVYYVLTYKLPLFLQAVEKQFPDHRRTKVLEFQFKEPSDRRVIASNFFGSNVEWNITFDGSEANSQEVIYASRLDQWGKDVGIDIEAGIYPPRFKLQICPRNQTSPNENVCVKFECICQVSEGREPIVDHFPVTNRTRVSQTSISSANLNPPIASTPELRALKAFHKHIIGLISLDISHIADIMWQRGLIPEYLQKNTPHVDGNSVDNKARNVMSVISTLIEICPSNFHVFIEGLKEAGEYTHSLISQLESAAMQAPSGPHQSLTSIPSIPESGARDCQAVEELPAATQAEGSKFSVVQMPTPTKSESFNDSVKNEGTSQKTKCSVM